MPKYNIIYEVTETYDAIDYYSLLDHIANEHWIGSLGRSWLDGGIRVIDIREVKGEEE